MPNDRPSPFTVAEPNFIPAGAPSQKRFKETVDSLICNLTLFAEFYEQASQDIKDARPHERPYEMSQRDGNTHELRELFRAIPGIDRLRAYVRSNYEEDLTIGTANRVLNELIRTHKLTVDEAGALTLEKAMDRLEGTEVNPVFDPSNCAASPRRLQQRKIVDDLVSQISVEKPIGLDVELADAFSAVATGVRECSRLMASIPSRSLTILDALYFSAGLLLQIEAGGHDRHWMTVAKSSSKMRTIETFGPDDHLVEMTVSDEARAINPNLPKTWRARAIGYQRPGFAKRILMTSLLDPVLYPVNEVREMYHERWELELGYDEIKTELADSQPTLRSKTPGGVRQEIWGILLGFNLVRLEMERIAQRAAVAPTRISFVAALHLIRTEWEWSAITRSPGGIPKHLAELEERIKRFVLPARRSARSYPRVVRDFRGYPRKKTRSPATK